MEKYKSVLTVQYIGPFLVYNVSQRGFFYGKDHSSLI